MTSYRAAGATLALAGFYAHEQRDIDRSNRWTQQAHPKGAEACGICQAIVRSALRKWIAREQIKTSVEMDARYTLPRVAIP